MDMTEAAEALQPGTPVLIVTYPGENEAARKYVGFLTGLDDIFLSAKVTHEEVMVEPSVLPESQKAVRELLAKRPMWLLHLQVGFKYRMLTIGLDREGLVERLADWLESMAIVETGKRASFVALPLPKHVSLSIGSIDRLESMNSIMDSAVLTELDFEPEVSEEDGLTQ